MIGLKRCVAAVMVVVGVGGLGVGVAGAAEEYGVSVTSYRYDYRLGQNIVLDVRNTGDTAVAARITPEAARNGGWSDFDFTPWRVELPVGEAEQDPVFTGDGTEINQAGRYRFRVEVDGRGTFHSDVVTVS